MTSKDVIELLIKLVDDFKLDHPQFLGMKAILTVRRDLTQTTTIDKMKRFTELHQSYPNFVIGFDLVGQVRFELLSENLRIIFFTILFSPFVPRFFFRQMTGGYWKSIE